ncbi:MAG TPA: hypothetical protein VEV87_03970 [Chitinophagaceae bacterium]|nr:hypothetical protein [Chitinophagaceae bacterium]
MNCSGFLFSRNGMPVSFNEKKFKDYFQLTASLTGKILHETQLPSLDLSIPSGVYRKDLSSYYSIQNELPRVYGIGSGGISESASSLRKAQALQLKGFLLFFDQLFANYLSQLSQMRKLFSFKKNKDVQSTYFSQLPQLLPDREKLLRFGIDDPVLLQANQGRTQAFPIDKKIIEEFIEQDILKNKDIEKDFSNLGFVTVAERDDAVYSLIENLLSRSFTIHTVETNLNCWFYYIFTASDEVALLSKNYYPDENAARVAAVNITYLGTFKENYYRYAKSGTSFSFNIEFNMAEYAVYLRQIVEDKELFLERRKAFLDHLLAMFAESFTDFALLSFDSLQEIELKRKDLAKKVSFLSTYDQLSRNRGKGYDYKRNGWNNGNISGFEKRVNAYAGIEDCCGQYLCNFEVLEYTGQYYWAIPFGGKNIFKANYLFDSEEEAASDLEAFLSALKNKDAYKPAKDSLSLTYNTREISYAGKFSSEQEASNIGEQLRQLLVHEPLKDEIFVSHLLYRAELVDEDGEMVRRTVQLYESPNKALTIAKTLVKKINDDDWEAPGMQNTDKPKLDLKSSKAEALKLVDVTPFTKDVILCPDEYRWIMNDRSGKPVMKSYDTYPSQQLALEGIANELTHDQIGRSSLRLNQSETTFSFELLTGNGNPLATSSDFTSEAAREEVIVYVLEFCQKERSDEQYTYEIKEACHWQVDFGNDLVFQSVSLFADKENAMNTWRKEKGLFRSLNNFAWNWDETGRQQLSINDERNQPAAVLMSQPEGKGLPEELFASIQQSLSQRSFRITTIQVETGYGFRMQDDQGNVLLSTYEVYTNRGAAFEAMLKAIDRAREESQYLKSGDEGNREFTFLLKNDGFDFIAEHPQIYDSETERDDVLQKAIAYLKNKQRPADTAKEKTAYTYGLRKGDNLLLNSTQKFPGMREISENANLVLLLASDSGNYTFYKYSAGGNGELRLMHSGQWIATAPDKLEDETQSQQARDRIIGSIRPNRYNVVAQPYADKWKFRFSLGMDYLRSQFQSTIDFDTEDAALDAYKKMTGDPAALKINRSEGNVLLVSKHKFNKANLSAALTDPAGVQIEESKAEIAERSLAITQLLNNLSTAQDKRTLQKMVKKDALAEEGTWVYRLRRKQDYFAYHLNCNNTGTDHEVLIKNLYTSVTHSRSFMLICLGGDDIIYEKKNVDTGEVRYHFQIVGRLVNYPPDSSSGEEFVLFISTSGYLSKEEAESAFNEKYLQVLKKASKAFNYGEGKYISLTEPSAAPIQGCSTEEIGVVYVPASTLQEKYGNDTAVAIADLVELSKSYPIRISGKNKFKFSLYDYKKKVSQFIGASYYDSPAEAMLGFFFLLVLIKNRKNYYWYCDPDTGNEFIVLREILLESKHRYLTEQAAWNGVEELIGVSHTDGSFHIYQSLEDCCYSFFVACRGKVIHPCTYDTSEAQKQAYDKLVSSFANYQLGELPDIKISADNTNYEVSYKGKLLARIPLSQANPNVDSCLPDLFDLIDVLLVLEKCLQIEEDGKFVLRNSDDKIVGYLDNPTITADEWINSLVEMVMSYPIYRKDGVFYFRLPYPPAVPDGSTTDPCGCGKELPNDPADCYLAWIGGCYSTCNEALTALKDLIPKLKVEENYRLVFDCICGAYRVEFVEEDSIVALNPQCYTTREMDCEAVERAKALINCEGMHVVEHILLRPRCDEHCDCLIPDCPDAHCHFTWKVDDDDPCTATELPACFTPGKDPYSCIATVMLPAWPLRFRKQANRDLVTKILQREAPSHVLLRIQYLSPKDLCAFETQFKLWTRWLGNKKNYCGETFDMCSYINFLFKRRLDCWWPVEYCAPCAPPVNVQTPCIELTSQDNRGTASRLSVNDVYCWNTPDCSYEYLRLNLKPEQENEKVKVIRKRTAQYVAQLNNIKEKLTEDPNIDHAISYLKGPVADEKGLIHVSSLLTVEPNNDDKEKKELYRQAFEVVIIFYLDRALLDQHDPSKLDDIRRTIRRVNFKKQQAPILLQKWNADELKGFVHERTIQALHGIIKNK